MQHPVTHFNSAAMMASEVHHSFQKVQERFKVCLRFFHTLPTDIANLMQTCMSTVETLLMHACCVYAMRVVLMAQMLTIPVVWDLSNCRKQRTSAGQNIMPPLRLHHGIHFEFLIGPASLKLSQTISELQVPRCELLHCGAGELNRPIVFLTCHKVLLCVW